MDILMDEKIEKKNDNDSKKDGVVDKDGGVVDKDERERVSDMDESSQQNHARNHAQYNAEALRKSINLDHLPKIKGYDYEKNAKEKFDLDAFIKSLGTTGFQASNLSKAIDVVNIMRREKATIFFGFTSNMISSGVREAITFLAKRKEVDFMVTAGGGVEEDVIKCLAPFFLGTFEVSGEQLFENGVNRTGNIFVPNDRYTYFDKFMRSFLEEMYARYTKEGKSMNTVTLTRELGLAIGRLDTKEESYLYWATKNNIPVLCPALMDGSIGDLVHFFRQQHPDFIIDTTSDMDIIIKKVLNAEKSGAIILGAGTVKHYILNTNIFREGLDYTVYINTSQEFDGSDSGARIEEAITWGKVKARTPQVKVHCDATIAFPLIMAATFAKP